MTLPPPYEIRIQNKRAAPAVCPICGKATIYPRDSSLSEVIRAFFTSPSRIHKRPVPGWKNYYSWWYVCLHDDSITLQLNQDNFLLNRVLKTGKFYGASYPLPLRRSCE